MSLVSVVNPVSPMETVTPLLAVSASVAAAGGGAAAVAAAAVVAVSAMRAVHDELSQLTWPPALTAFVNHKRASLVTGRRGGGAAVGWAAGWRGRWCWAVTMGRWRGGRLGGGRAGGGSGRLYAGRVALGALDTATDTDRIQLGRPEQSSARGGVAARSIPLVPRAARPDRLWAALFRG